MCLKQTRNDVERRGRQARESMRCQHHHIITSSRRADKLVTWARHSRRPMTLAALSAYVHSLPVFLCQPLVDQVVRLLTLRCVTNALWLHGVMAFWASARCVIFSATVVLTFLHRLQFAMAATPRRLAKTITVIGGGNGAHVCVAYFASIGLRVNLLTRKPQEWSKTVSVTTKGCVRAPILASPSAAPPYLHSGLYERLCCGRQVKLGVQGRLRRHFEPVCCARMCCGARPT